MVKRSIVFLLAFVMLFGVLTACGDGSRENGSSSGGASLSQDSGTAASGAESESGVKDFGTVKFIISESYSQGKEIGKVAEYIKEKSGVLIEPVYSDFTTDKFTLMIAAGEEIDSVSASPSQFSNYLNNNSIMTIDELIDEYGTNLTKRVNPDLWGWCKKDGKTYAVPNESISVPQTIQIRKDWIEARGLSMPQTMEEFKDVMRVFAKEYNTNPLFIENPYDYSIGGFFLPMGYSWWKSDDGTYLPPEMHPEYKNLLQELNAWYKEGIIHPETFSGNRNQLIEANKIGGLIGWYSGAFNACFNLTK